MRLYLNKVFLSGRLTADPELKQTQSGTSVTSFSIAVDRMPDKDGNKTTDFINIVAWTKTAELVTRYFRKGNPIFIEGEIQVRKWQNQNGENRYATEVIARNVHFVESKAASEGTAPSAPSSEPSAAPITPPGDLNPVSVDDDDLPF